MKILCDSKQYFKNLFPELSFGTIQYADEWKQFTSHPLVCQADVYSPLDELNGSEALLMAEDFADSSQFDRLRDMSNINCPICAIARTGFGFHGKNQRVWQTYSGNLHLCYALPLSSIPEVPQLLIAALLIEAIRSVCSGLSETESSVPFPLLEIKPPNDILLNEKKLAGILTSVRNLEQNSNDGGNCCVLTVGIGVNLVIAPELSIDAYAPAACLLDEGFAPGIVELVERINHLLAQGLRQ